MSIYKFEPKDHWPERYTIASRGCWLPGNYDSERTARYAFKFTNRVLDQLQTDINHAQQRPIRFDDLRATKKKSLNPG